MGRQAAPFRQILACGTAAGLLLGAVLPGAAQQGPLPTPSLLARGLVYLRIQAPGSPEPVHRNAPAGTRVERGVMLDNPARTSRPLLLERIRVGEKPFLVLERQLSSQSRSVRGGTLQWQRIQVLDVHPLPEPEVEILSPMAGMAACRRNGKPDVNVVAIRRRLPDDSGRTVFSDLLRAWRVDRRTLRLEPLPENEVSCVNEAAGAP